MENNLPAPAYKVVIDRENQYSLWPIDRSLPTGWQEAGKTGTEKECLEYISENSPAAKYAKSRAAIGK